MDLAIKWLFFLALVMWVSLCSLHIQMQRHEESSKAAFSPPVAPTENHLFMRAKLGRLQENPAVQVISYIHYFTFIAGALVVAIYNRRNEIINFTQHQFVKMKSRIKFKENAKKSIMNLKNALINLKFIIIGLKFSVCSNIDFIEKLRKVWVYRKLPFFDLKQFYYKQCAREQRVELLLKRLKEVAQERNKLGLLLVAATHENKNIKQQWQVDRLAKTRLLHEIQTTQKQIKELRSKYINFQQLYLVTHQENIFLKNCVKKLTKDKAESDENLMLLVSKVYQSNDSTLKGYCTCFLVKNKENVTAKDVESKVQKLLHKHHAIASTSVKQARNDAGANLNNNQSRPTEKEVKDDGVVKFESEEPKPVIRGLPGEYVWTVKDKDGIIEKLYQYDHGIGFDNGDTIRRIREYSVYHDKDCLLDFTNSRSTTIIHDRSDRNSSETLPNVELPSKRNFLTKSPVFQKFLQNNQNLVMASLPTPAPPLLCG